MGRPDLELVRGLLCVPNVHAASLDAPRSPLLSPLSVVCDDLRIGRRLVHALGCPDAPVFALDAVVDADLDGTRRLILWVSNPPLALLRDRIRRSRPMRRVVMVAPPHRTALFKLGAAEGVPVVGCPSSIEALAERLTSQLGLRRDTPLPAPVRAVTPIPPPPRVTSDQLLGELERSLRRRLGPSAALEMARPDTLSFLVEKAAEAAIGQLRQSPGSALVSLDDPDDDVDPRGWVPGSSGWYRRPTEEAPDAPTAPWPALAPAEVSAPARPEPAPVAPAAVSTPAVTPRASTPAPSSPRGRPWLRRTAVLLSAVAGVGLALAVHHSFEAEIEAWLQGVSAPSAVAAPAVSTDVREAVQTLSEVTEEPTELVPTEVAPTELAPTELERAQPPEETSTELSAERSRERARRRRVRARARAARAAEQTTADVVEPDASASGATDSATSETPAAPEASASSQPSPPPEVDAAASSTTELDPALSVLDPWAS
ncbi:MAG: hypothetical protein AB8I08_11585 [Sandaracinaceae bacterium]